MKKLLTGCLILSAMLFSVNASLAGSCNDTKTNCQAQSVKTQKDCTCNNSVANCDKDCDCGCQDKAKKDCTCNNSVANCDKDCDCGCQNEKRNNCKKENIFKRIWSFLF